MHSKIPVSDCNTYVYIYPRNELVAFTRGINKPGILQGISIMNFAINKSLANMSNIHKFKPNHDYRT